MEGLKTHQAMVRNIVGLYESIGQNEGYPPSPPRQNVDYVAGKDELLQLLRELTREESSS